MLASSLASSKLLICARSQYQFFFRRQRAQHRLCQTSYRGLRPFTARHASTAVDPGSSAGQDLTGDNDEIDDTFGSPLENYNLPAEDHEKSGRFLWRRPSRNALWPRMRDQQLTFSMQDGNSVVQQSLRGANTVRHIIDHQVLGEPAEVVVLPSDTRPTRPTPLPASKKTDEVWQENVQLSGPEILEQIARERGIIGEDTWFANMESLKKELLGKHGTLVTREKYFREMSDKIYNSFTKPQLTIYITKSMEAKTSDKDINDLDFSRVFAGKNIARTAWFTASARPVLPDLSEKTNAIASDSRLREKNLKFLDKRELADYIVRRVWNVQMRVSDGRNGKIGIRLEPTAFDLIVNHRENFLKGFAKSYGVKIEAVRSLKAIWVTSDLEGCEDVWKSLCSMAERIQRKTTRYETMDGHVKAPRKTGEDVLNEIGKLTNTKLIPVTRQEVCSYS